MSNHVSETGCGLTREDFHPVDDEPCVDGGLPDEHPARCNHNCEITQANLAPNARHYLDCPVWAYFGVGQ